MALVKCKECGKEVSKKAETCPHCGIKNPGITTSEYFIGFIVLFGIVGIGFAMCSSNDKPSPPIAEAPKEAPKEKPCAQDDLECLGNKGVISAGVFCKDKIERLAKHSVRWTDGMLEMKFSRFKWKNKSSGIITYIGDKVEFQNGFGAFSPMIYTCDLSADNKTVLNVSVREGRLSD